MATDRRRFFAGGLAAGAAALSACGKKKAETGPGSPGQPTGPLHAFLVENGQPGQAGFSVGMLVTRDPAGQIRALTELRRRTRFRTGLEFASTNRFKLAFLEPAFAHLAAGRDLRGRMVTATGFAGWAGKSAADRLAAHAAAYRALLDGLVPAERAGLFVHLSPRSSAGRRDAKLAAALQAGLGRGATVSLDGDRFRDLPQLASVVFGTVRYATGPMRSKTKRRGVELLKAALKLPRLDAAALNGQGKLAVATAGF